jgi:chemotaxis protein MotB
MGKKKCKKAECPPGEKWAVPFADFFSLLLALFIALYALSSVNKEKVKAVKEEFVKIYDYAPVPESVNPVVDMVSETKTDSDASGQSSGTMPVSDGGAVLEQTPSVNQEIMESISNIQSELQKASMGDGALDQAMDGVLMKLPATIPFRGSSVTLENEEMNLFIKRVADLLNTLPPSVQVSVRGYTDDSPVPAGSTHRDNLELSNRRAEAVVRALIQNGVAPERLSAAGFGSAQPIAANTNESNRAKNRRVELYMFISNETPIDTAKQQSILDALGKLQK